MPGMLQWTSKRLEVVDNLMLIAIVQVQQAESSMRDGALEEICLEQIEAHVDRFVT